MDSTEELSFGFDDGWCNGNPREMIKRGSYARYRGLLKGFTEEQMEEFDALEKEAKPARDAAVKKQVEIRAASKLAGDKKSAERKAEYKKKAAKREATMKKKEAEAKKAAK